jgi:hypothetical protein
MTTRFGHYATNMTSTKVLSAMAKFKGEGMMVKATKDSEAGKMPSEELCLLVAPERGCERTALLRQGEREQTAPWAGNFSGA